MAALKLILAVVAVCACAHAVEVPVRADDVQLSLEPELRGGFHMVLVEGDKRTVFGHIGRTLAAPFTSEDVEGGVEIHIGGAILTVHTTTDDSGASGIKVRWEGDGRLEDCIDFGTKHWYAGPMQANQIYPIQLATQIYQPYVSKEQDNGAIMERYWLNSAGEYIYVHPEVPLFVDYNDISPNHICFGAQIADPYSSRRNQTELVYDIWFLSDVKAAHKHAVANYLGKPSDAPDYRMVEHPIWSTWAQYSRDIDETKLHDYIHEVLEYGFNNSQLEIDDQWEVCYGSLTVNENKFPNFTAFVQDVKDHGFRVTMWAHPFINSNCEPWYSEALNNGYLVLSESGSPVTSWWNNNGSQPGYVDFTNPAAAEWWYQRVMFLVEEYGIDSLKFDAGESSFSPQIPVQTGDINLHPHHITEAYVRTCARFGGMIEVRTGFRTQELPVFVRMVDRDSVWGLNNGLSTVITTTLQMNLNGYTFVLPDMIGGNGFNLDHEQSALPSKELFIRWVQVNTFLPVMQFSYAPWNFDDETVLISRKYTELHAEYAEYIYAVMQASVEAGTPVNAPLWWVDPLDQEAQLIWDEFLLGERILVAPVLEEGVTSRNIYLPAGTWYEEGDPERVHEGPIWLRDHPAPLDTLPYFIREFSGEPDAGSVPGIAAILVLLGLLTCIVFSI